MGANFSGADFDHCFLSGSILIGANFENAKFEAGNAYRTDFTDANLKNASFLGTNAEEAIFTGANLEGADFSFTYLLNATLDKMLQETKRAAEVVTRLRDFFRAGIEQTNAWAMKTYGMEFDRLPQDKREEAMKALEAVMDGYQVMPMGDAAKVGDFFCTVTGDINVIDESHFKVMKEKCGYV